LVRARLAGVVTPATVADARYVPGVPFAVAVTLATPSASVLADAADSSAEAPEPGTPNDTVMLWSGLPIASATPTTSGASNAVPVGVCCPEPLITNTLAGVASMFCSENETSLVMPLDDALTWNAPAVAFAVASTLANPELSVTAVVLLSVADAPLPGAANVTVAPGTGEPAASVNSMVSGAKKAVPMGARFGSLELPPEMYVSLLGTPELVRVNVATDPTPETVADTE
jgi:hypothetical protein